MDNNNMANNDRQPQEERSVISYWNDDNAAPDSYMIKTRTMESVNRTFGAMALHFIIMLVIQFILMTAYQMPLIKSGMKPEEIVAAMQSDGIFLLAVTAIGYTVAHICGYFIGLGMTHRLKGAAKIFRKPDISAKELGFCILAIPASQFVTSILQNLFVLITGSSGMENMNLDMISFGDDPKMNILLFMYMVILGPIGEELVMRGMALRNMTVTNLATGIFGTAIIFGIFHGNIMQFFVGLMLGTLLAYVTVKSGSVLPAMLMHILNNLFAYGLSVLTYYLDVNEEHIEIINIAILAAFAVLGTIGIIGLIRCFKGKELSEDNPYRPIYIVSDDERKQFGLVSILKCPCFYVFFLMYLILIIQNI